VERRVEHRDLRQVRAQGAGDGDAVKVRRVVQRGERGEALDGRDDLVGDQGRARNSAPPCTTRCPTATSSGASSRMSPAADRSAASWSGGPPGSPMRSTRPFATTPSSASETWYFTDDERC